ILLKLLDLPGELVNLLLQVVRWRPLRGHRGVVMEHRQGTNQHYHAQNTLHHLLPGVANIVRILLIRRLFRRWLRLVGNSGFGHGGSSECYLLAARVVLPTVLKGMYVGYVKPAGGGGPIGPPSDAKRAAGKCTGELHLYAL